MLHHSIGDVGDGSGLGAWGYPGRDGRGERRAAPRGHGARRDRAHRRPGRAGRYDATAGSPASPSPTATRSSTDLVVTAVHPQIGVPPPPRRQRAARRLRRRHPPLAQPQRHGEDQPRAVRAARLHVASRHAPAAAPHRGDRARPQPRLPRDARSSRPAAGRRRPGRSATAASRSVFDDSLAPPGHHVMSLFTQWVPHTWSEEPHQAELEAYADRVIDGYAELAPNLKARSCTARSSGPTRWSTPTA